MQEDIMNVKIEKNENRKYKNDVKKRSIDKSFIKLSDKIYKQKEYFRTGITKDITFRLNQLKILKKAIKKNEHKILEALNKDLRKSNYEAYTTEMALLYQEIDHAVKNLKKWSKSEKVKNTSLYQTSKSYIVHEPLGHVLIIGPWNYPFQLIIAPLVASIAAGNISLLKPSELAPETSKVVKYIISENFDERFILAAEGDRVVSQYLLSEKFDHIFFTGGIEIGKIIMKAAAENLSSVTLELGGKSPVIVAKDANIEDAAKKIAWGKYLNAGQTCIAPDYILVHESVKNKLIVELKKQILKFYGNNPQESKDYSRIVNVNHFNRLINYLNYGKIAIGGRFDESDKYIEPTVLDGVALNTPVMKEEIFGPILPLVEFESLDEVFNIVESLTKPLALYLFTESRKIKESVLNMLSSGGAVINDVVLHVGHHNLPFGGVGHSGMGAYHGKFGFNELSHQKAVLEKPHLFNLPLRYPPYKIKLKWLKKFL
jgi:aldehyde dehydrogenase (NAD+)